MRFVQVSKKDAEKTKWFLLEHNWLNHDYSVMSEKDVLLFPITENAKMPKTTQIVERDGIFRERAQKDLKQAFSSVLTPEQQELLKTSHDVIGDIAIIEVEKELEPFEQQLAQFLLRNHKYLKTVVKKSGVHQGDFRTQDLTFIAGEDKRETIHKENGVRLKLKVGEVYFSVRLSTERSRIAALIKPDERVLVMFSGCGPYTCVFGKNTKAKEIIGVEWNPLGHEYALENIKLNKLKNVSSYCGDVRQIVPTLLGKFDRILMPLPKTADDYLDVALSKAHKGTVIHFYDFLNEKEFHIAYDKIAAACKEAKLAHKLLQTVKCGQHAPYVFRICVDFEIQ